MAIDATWLAQNLGIRPPRARLRAAAASGVSDASRAIARELIDFDSEGAAGALFRASAPLAPSGLSPYVNPTWPAGLAPMAGSAPAGEALPRSDVMIVTWTVDEGHALSRVLTPGFDSARDWLPYTKNFASISAQMRAGCPARQAGRLGTYWTTMIGTKRITLFKSDSHLSQDGPKLPNALVWRQIIADTQASLVITTGTGGGIGAGFEVGDVIVSRYVSFDCRRTFKALNGQAYVAPAAIGSSFFAEATTLFGANAGFLPKGNPRTPPRITIAPVPAAGVLTTDFFGFDNTTDSYGLEGHGDLSEMGDAVLGMVCAELGAAAPNYAVVRNVSDPQIDATGQTLAQQAATAAAIYKGFGRWSSVCSAIVCWAIVAGL
jgi:nucleoside phosphorylase